MKKKAKRSTEMISETLEKTATGIAGLDEITDGGLPKGRPTLICGTAGCGKTVLSLEFLVRGAVEHGEPGVFMAFEETEEDLTKNVASMGFNLKTLAAQKKILVDYVHIERSEIEETGEYDLEGLFIRLGHAIDSIGAKRVVLDTIEVLFASLPNEAILRAELRRLFRWLKDKGVTAIITAERGREAFTRHGLEEYVADCVILLDHRVNDQVSTRRLRVVKYRGSVHGTNEYPFMIGTEGVSVLPITSLGLDHTASEQRVSSGIPRLDTMLGGKGYYRGSSVLVSGTAGSGKTSLAAGFVDAAARRGERCLYFAFEESQSQILRNMRSIGIDLEPSVRAGLVQFHASRPTLCGLEMHLLEIHNAIRKEKPKVVVIDPVTNLINTGTGNEVRSMLTRLIDCFKTEQITAFFTSLTSGESGPEQTEVGVSSLMDTWLLTRNLESNGERNRGLYVLKSRGMPHSNQIREFILSKEGIQLLDVYVGADTLLTGSARLAQESREKAAASLRQQEIGRRSRELERERQAIEAQIATLRAGLEAKADQFKLEIAQDSLRQSASAEAQLEIGKSRMADGAVGLGGRQKQQRNGV
jgi:circadian clock protein KaiC